RTPPWFCHPGQQHRRPAPRVTTGVLVSASPYIVRYERTGTAPRGRSREPLSVNHLVLREVRLDRLHARRAGTDIGAVGQQIELDPTRSFGRIEDVLPGKRALPQRRDMPFGV